MGGLRAIPLLLLLGLIACRAAILPEELQYSGSYDDGVVDTQAVFEPTKGFATLDEDGMVCEYHLQVFISSADGECRQTRH